MMPSLRESIIAERDPEVPDDELNMAGRIRRRLFAGDVMRPKEVVATFGGSNGMLAAVCAQLETVGFHVHRDADDTSATYRLLNPKYVPSDAEYDRARRQASKKRSKMKAKAEARTRQDAPATSEPKSVAVATTIRAAAEGSPPKDRAVADRGDGLPPLPTLGQPLSVSAMALNDDGSVSLVVRNGAQRWITTVEGCVNDEATS